MRALFERVRVDIADFEPRGAPLVQGAAAAGEGFGPANHEGFGFGPSARPWVALGKHLCGAATDLTLRCCARHCACADPDEGLDPASRPSSRPHAPETEAHCAARLAAADRVAADSSTSPAGSRAGGLRGGTAATTGGGMLGLAVATCCHHRCTWRDFVGKRLFLSLGFTPADFEVVCYMCAWANGGHDAAPAAAASRVPEPRGGPGGSGGGRVCVSGNHDAAPGGAAPSRQPDPCELFGGISSERADTIDRLNATPSGAATVVGDSDPEAGLDRVERGCGAPAATGSEQQASDDDRVAQGSNGTESCTSAFQPYFLPIVRRMALGAAAKQLIDAARVHYLRGHKLGNARAVQYVSQQVSCENRLLVATTSSLNAARTMLCPATCYPDDR